MLEELQKKELLDKFGNLELDDYQYSCCGDYAACCKQRVFSLLSEGEQEELLSLIEDVEEYEYTYEESVSNGFTDKNTPFEDYVIETSYSEESGKKLLEFYKNVTKIKIPDGNILRMINYKDINLFFYVDWVPYEYEFSAYNTRPDYFSLSKEEKEFLYKEEQKKLKTA